MWIELSVITLCLEIKWLPAEEIHVLTSWQVFEEQNNLEQYLEHKPPVILEKSIITKKKAGIYNGLSVQPPESLPQSYQADKQIHKLKLLLGLFTGCFSKILGGNYKHWLRKSGREGWKGWHLSMSLKSPAFSMVKRNKHQKYFKKISN